MENNRLLPRFSYFRKLRYEVERPTVPLKHADNNSHSRSYYSFMYFIWVLLAWLLISDVDVLLLVWYRIDTGSVGVVPLAAAFLIMQPHTILASWYTNTTLYDWCQQLCCIMQTRWYSKTSTHWSRPLHLLIKGFKFVWTVLALGPDSIMMSILNPP
jgi:hypothetical protein